MKTVRAKLRSVSPYSQSRPVSTVKPSGKSNDAHEEETWREKIHSDSKGMVFIPPMAFKNCLSETAKYLSETVPGKGKATYTKHFDAGVMVIEPIMLGIKAADVECERLFLPSNGEKGGGKRVWKHCPIITDWSGTVEIVLLDPILIDKPEKVHEYLTKAGQFIGVGRFRPRNGGYYGRFVVDSFEVVS